MFLLIEIQRLSIATLRRNFNTTLVFINRYGKTELTYLLPHFNTTLVFINRKMKYKVGDKVRDFNTTLVFINQKRKELSKEYQQKFQYNSCFYLSMSSHRLAQQLINFNTTLVFIYQETYSGNEIKNGDFNTTLVFIYRNLCSFIESQCVISIQLLFLFIQRISAIPYFHYSHFP